MDEPVWLDRLIVDAMHYDQMQQHGGLFGIKDENALDSALARPRQKWAYEPTTDLCALAADYGYGLANDHPYSDGNKRIAFASMYTFLGVNGWEIIAPEPQVVRLIIDVASGRCSEKQLAKWLRDHVEPFPG